MLNIYFAEMAALMGPFNRRTQFWRWRRVPKLKVEATDMESLLTIRPRKFIYLSFDTRSSRPSTKFL